jgi:hypothetical protein
VSLNRRVMGGVETDREHETNEYETSPANSLRVASGAADRHLGNTRLGVPRLLEWPVVDEDDAFMIEDLACLW